MSSWVQDRKSLEKLAGKFDKRIKLHTKGNVISRVIAWLLFIVSFGRFKREVYLKNTATALANHHFYPEEWPTANVATALPHEARHTRQLTICGFSIHPLLGLPIAALIYGVLLFPAGLALGRFLFEWDADKAKYRYMLSEENSELLHAWIRRSAELRAERLSSVMYLWAVPKPLATRWYSNMAEKVIYEATSTKLG